jgi:hypothetical protein
MREAPLTAIGASHSFNGTSQRSRAPALAEQARPGARLRNSPRLREFARQGQDQGEKL